MKGGERREAVCVGEGGGGVDERRGRGRQWLLVVCVGCGCQAMGRSVRVQGQSRACMQTLSKRVMQCPPNQAGHDVATQHRTGKKACVWRRGAREGHKKDKDKQNTNKQHKQPTQFSGGGREEVMCSFMNGDVLAKISALAFLSRRRPGRDGALLFPLS